MQLLRTRLSDKMDYNLPKLPIREENSNKGTFGKILNVSGSEYMSGAAILSSLAAYRVGAGYVELVSHRNVLKAVACQVPEVVLVPLEKLNDAIKNSTVLLIGCGLSTNEDAVAIFKQAIELAVEKDLPTIIDADGLNVLAKNQVELPKNVILTPHPKEAARLLNCSLDVVLNDMNTAAKKICERYNSVTVLKSHTTIVMSPSGEFYSNTTGNNALAKAGSGDVLSGMISGLVAQKMTVFEASVLGVYLHGLAGDLAKEDLSAYGVLASDTIRYVTLAIKNYLNCNI